MDRYEIEAAAYKIDGYYFPPLNNENANISYSSRRIKFEDARRECLLHLEKSIENVWNITFDEFLKGRR